MNRRAFHRAALGVASGALGRRLFAQGSAPYEPTWASLKTHPVPDWYRNAKFGIFVHWGLYSVPAWAVPTGELGKVQPDKWFIDNPYAEWYLNTLRIAGSPTAKHHAETYGKDFDYYNFRPMFNQAVAAWDPNVMVSLFQIGTRCESPVRPRRNTTPRRTARISTTTISGRCSTKPWPPGTRMSWSRYFMAPAPAMWCSPPSITTASRCFPVA